MDYQIKRTSLGGEKPCKEAFEKSVPNWHERTCSEEEFNRKFSEREGKWRDKGTNHKCGKNFVRRREGNKIIWAVKIDTIEQLIKFSKKYGKMIFTEKSIEIYDDYRESI